MHRRVAGDVVLLPARRRTLGVVAVDGRLVVGGLVAEQLAHPRAGVVVGDEQRLVVVTDLVAEVAEQGAVRLGHLDAHALTVGVVALGEVERDHPVDVTDGDVLGDAGQQVERQAVVGVVVAGDDRQPEGVELDDQPALGRLGAAVNCDSPRRSSSARAGPGERAAEARLPRPLRQPGTPEQVAVDARVPDPALGVDVDAVGPDRDDVVLTARIGQRRSARDADGVVEEERVRAHPAGERTHRLRRRVRGSGG